ncbi:MAG: YceD family protein [Alphaproteobacteria bacterium]
MKKISPEFSYIVDVRQIPVSGLTLDLRADEAQRRALADRFDIPSIKALSARVVLTKINKDRVRVNGTFEADVEQICVVTLEPFVQQVQDHFSVIFSQEEDPSLKLNEIDLDMDEDNDVEILENGKIDVGELTAEFLSLALDPFPHAPDAVFQPESAPEIQKNAFSVLEKLKFK